MNLLAHAYLSFNREDILLGNMISDFVKGKQQFNFPKEIRKGVMLHRRIDSFTDMHPIVSKAKLIFKPFVGLYAGAFVDVSFDYFLANDLNEMSANQWKEFSQTVYLALEKNKKWFPERFARFFPYMKQEDWLYNYRYLSGIEKSFNNVLMRAKYLEKGLPVMEAFEMNLSTLSDCYTSFFPELKKYAFAHLETY